MDDYMASNMGSVSPLASEMPRCPINVAARRSGLSAHVIRAWERRYSAITPDRTSKSRRLYSDWEVRRLVLLRQAVELGHRIGEIARLPMEQLRPLVGRDTLPGVEASPRIPLPRSRLVEMALESIGGLDAAAFSQSLLQATRILDVPELFDDFVALLMTELRQQVASRRLRVAHQRFATAYLRSFLGDLLAAGGAGPCGASVLVATPPGESDETAALMAAITASRAGWDAIYAGAGVPADELAFIAQRRGARAVVLALSASAEVTLIDVELAALRTALGADLPILCTGLPPARRSLVGEQLPTSLRDLAQQLQVIRPS